MKRRPEQPTIAATIRTPRATERQRRPARLASCSPIMRDPADDHQRACAGAWADRTRNGPIASASAPDRTNTSIASVGRADQRLTVNVETGIEHGADLPTAPRLDGEVRRTRRDHRLGRIAGGTCRRRLSRPPADPGSRATPRTPSSCADYGASPVCKDPRAFALEHARTEWLVPHATLQHEIQAVPQRRPVRPRQHAAVTERSRAVFHPALKPHDDAPLVQQIRNPDARFSARLGCEDRRFEVPAAIAALS